MAENEFKYDVFISYSHKDEEWVVSILLPVLENADLKVCIDYRDFDAGKPSIVNMEDAVDESRHTVLVLTPNWTNSEWTDFEAVLTQTDDPVGRRQKMIPIMLEKCTPPKRVRSLTYVDFMRSDRLDNAWAQLFKALGKPNAPIPTSATQKRDTGSRESWQLAHPYPMPPNFTGRVAERVVLTEWLNDDTENRLFIIRALGGFGKSALSWHWLTHDVDPNQWPKVVWWSFYEGDASFEHFIEETLKYLKLEVPQGQRPQVDELLKAMQGQKILLIMDGFERALRAYSSMNAPYQGDEPKVEDNQLDCVNINAEIFLKSVCSLPNIKSKVLLTTRLTPRVVKPRGEFMLGCCEEQLNAMQKEDAIEFFRKQGIKGTHAEIEAACASYGYHPLSLRLLAGRILKDFENPADIIVAQKLKIDGDIIQQKHHVLEVAYSSLPQHEQKLLSMIACFRSPVELKTLEAIAENKNSLNDDLHDLVERGLLHFDEKNKKFDLHPVVRSYAYERLTAPDRTGAHERLVNYFEAVPNTEKVEKLEDLAPVIELYHHIVRSGKFDEAILLFRDRLTNPLYFQIGAYQIIVELLLALFLDGEDKPPRLGEERDKAWSLQVLASVYSVVGQPRRAIPIYKLQISLISGRGNERILASAFGALGSIAYLPVGALKLAESSLQKRVELAQQSQDEFSEAIGYQDLCELFVFEGLWEESKNASDKGIEIANKRKNHQIECVIRIYLAQRALLMKNISLALSEAAKAKELADIPFPGIGVLVRDQIGAGWILGSSLRINGNLREAEHYLSEALTRDRAINLVDHEARILLDLARLRYDQKKYEEAKSFAEEALLITERCGYVLQGADVNLFLAQYALEQENDKAKAKEYAETALKLATCDGPPYYYKVAYHEAERMLEKLA